jgi:chemotaxis protein CheZ
MAVQRKVFRIEQSAVAYAPEASAAAMSDEASRHREFMAELQALRALIEPRSRLDREAIERARAQIVEAQAYKCELDLIYAAVKRTRDEIGRPSADAMGAEQSARVGRELQAIVAGAERATQAILQAAEEIEQTASTLSAVVKSGHEKGLAHDIQDRVVQIFEACNFQDLTGQRITKVAAALQLIEDRVGRLVEIWHGIERFKPVVLDGPAESERRYLNGPRLPDEPGHSSQGEIDVMFGCA